MIERVKSILDAISNADLSKIAAGAVELGHRTHRRIGSEA